MYESMNFDYPNNTSLISDQNQLLPKIVSKPSVGQFQTIQPYLQGQYDLNDRLREVKHRISQHELQAMNDSASQPLSNEFEYKRDTMTFMNNKAYLQQSGQFINMDIQHLNDLLVQQQEWINIQPITKESLGVLLNISVQHQNQLNSLTEWCDGMQYQVEKQMPSELMLEIQERNQQALQLTTRDLQAHINQSLTTQCNQLRQEIKSMQQNQTQSI